MDPASFRKSEFSKFKIAVLGLGHVGLPTAVGLADLGWDVIGADQDSSKVRLIAAGTPPFYEPGLEPLLLNQLASKKFQPTDDVVHAVRSASVIFLCVGTPQRPSGEADLTQIEYVARLVGRNLNAYKLIVEKSTVPAITAQWIRRTVSLYATKGEAGERDTGQGANEAPGRDFAANPFPFEVASNPEFIQEGKAVEAFFHPSRIILGIESDRARRILEAIYQPLDARILVTDLTTAELIKYAANAFLATKISFINMVADVCDSLGADVTMVAHGIGLDPRIGPAFLNAGIGFGGYCFPKDLRAFIHLVEELGLESSLLQGVEEINLLRTEVFLKKLRQALWVLNGKTIALLGLAFKPGTDDVREAPSLRIAESLLREGAAIRLYDPQAMPGCRRALPEEPGRVIYCNSPYHAAEGAQALLLVTEWDQFRELDWARLRVVMDVPILLDGRNFIDPAEVRAAGFGYIGMGRGNAAAERALSPSLSPIPSSRHEDLQVTQRR
ncbi:MAG: UDP-glucose/GDP-mannose dehydrogenase family protein [Acidobacteriia bacterium]|nr:UDP-glucose/GDP-mannose dehydrogenase family protein [Terriglobia bacterium]